MYIIYCINQKSYFAIIRDVVKILGFCCASINLIYFQKSILSIDYIQMNRLIRFVIKNKPSLYEDTVEL